MNLNRISNTLKKRLAGLGAENISITGPNEKGRCEVKALLFGRVEYKCVMNSKTNFVSGRADAVLDEMSENEVRALADEMTASNEYTPNAFDKNITLLDSFKAEDMNDAEAYDKINGLLNTIENFQDVLQTPDFAAKKASQEDAANFNADSSLTSEDGDEEENDEVEPGMSMDDDDGLLADFESALADINKADGPMPETRKAPVQQSAPVKKQSKPQVPVSKPESQYSSEETHRDMDGLDAELDALMSDLESDSKARKPQPKKQQAAQRVQNVQYEQSAPRRAPVQQSAPQPAPQPAMHPGQAAKPTSYTDPNRLPPDIKAYYKQIDDVFAERKSQADERERRLDEFYNRIAERSEAVEKQAEQQQKDYDSIIGRAQAEAYKIKQSADEYAARKKAETEDECAKQLLEISKDRAKVDDEKHQVSFEKMKLKEREDNLERGRRNLEEEKKILETDKRYSIITDDDAMEMQKKIEDLTFQMGLKEKEISNLNDSLKKAKAKPASSSASVFDSLKKERDELRKENGRLEDENGRLKSENATLKMKSNERDAASDEVIDENRRLRSTVESLNDTISKQERAIDLLKQKKTSLDKELDRRRDTIEKLRSGSGMAEENSKLADALKSTRMENDSLSLEIESLNAQVEALEQKVSGQAVVVPEKAATAEDVCDEMNKAGYHASVKTLKGSQIAMYKNGNLAIVVDPAKRCFLVSKQLARGSAGRLKKPITALNDTDISSSYDINTKNVLTCKHAYTDNVVEELKTILNEFTKMEKSYNGGSSRFQVDQDDAANTKNKK